MLLPTKDWTPLTTNKLSKEQNHVDTSIRPTATESAVLRNGASTKKFSSRQPNNALLWALIDDSELGREAHEEAVAIMDNWQPGPWKGMVWRGPVGKDREWNGSSWEATTGQPVAHKPYQPQTSLESPSYHSIRVFSEPLPELEAAVELNKQYEAWVKDPSSERLNLYLTLNAFVRSTWRKAQVRMLLKDTTMCVEADEIFTDFVLNLQERMDKGQYSHLGKLDGWIATIWSKYFFPDQQRKLYDYTNAARFINNVDPSAPEYKHETYCVNTEHITSDVEQGEPGYLYKGRRESDGKLITYRITGDRILRELDDPSTEFGQLDEISKKMLRGIANGEPQQKIAADLDVSDRTLRRKLKQVKALLIPDGTQELEGMSL